jgi:hypothetical protein
MPSSVGPNTFGEDNLVFGYDLGDVRNSYKGKPTTNFIADLGDPTEERARGEFGQYFNLVPIFETYGLVPYTLSMEIKGNIPGYCSVYMQNGSYTKYGFVSAAVEITTEWQRFVFPNITPSGPTAAWQANTPGDNRAMLATYTIYGTGRNPTIRNVQLELGSYATPFTPSARSVTQGLLDLTGNSTINLSNVSFDSNAQMTFDGSNDYATLSSASHPTGSCSMEIVFNHTHNFVGSRYLLYGANGSSFWVFFRGDWAGNLLYFLRRVTNTGNYADSAWGGYTGIYQPAPANETMHLIFTHDAVSGEFKSYKNGILTRTVNGNLAAYGALNTTQQSHYLGGSPGDNLPMTLPLFKFYDRVLTASEIQSNYNAIKGRFNI